MKTHCLALGASLLCAGWIAVPVAHAQAQPPEQKAQVRMPAESAESAESAEYAEYAESGESLPRWEFGLAAAALKVPSYPSSSISSERQFLVPWFVYRGDKLRLQDGGAKLIALENQRVTLDVSVALSLNASSEDAPQRAGMPELDYLFELGPKIDVRLFEEQLDNGQQRQLSWSTALRAAVSTDFKSANGLGGVLGTQLRYRHKGLASGRAAFSASLTANWAAESLLDYIYQVDPAFALPDRPAFDARGGYIGTTASLGFLRTLNDRWSAYLGLSANFHQGAANRDSPLFERNSTFGIFGGVSWEIRRSRDSIRVYDE